MNDAGWAGASRVRTVMAVFTTRCCSASKSSRSPVHNHQLAVKHAVDTDLPGQRRLDVGGLRGEVIAVARPQPHLAAAAHRADAAS